MFYVLSEIDYFVVYQIRCIMYCAYFSSHLHDDKGQPHNSYIC